MSARVDEQEVAIADVYAGSLLDLAERRGVGDAVLEELEALGELIDRHPEFAAFLSNPTVDFEARRTAIERVFRGKADDLVVNTLQVMNRRSRLDLLGALAAAYRRDLDALRGRRGVEVVTAVELTEGLRERLTKAISTLTGADTRLVESVDPSLIGGLVVKIGDRKIDTSVARSLALLDGRFDERTSAEVQRAHAYVAESEANGTDEVER